MAKTTRKTTRRPSRPVRRVEAERPDYIIRRFQDEIIAQPKKWVLIALGLGFLYGYFRR